MNLTQMWYYPEKSIIYRFVSTRDVCEKYSRTYTINDINFCAGSDPSSRYVTTLTIAQTLSDVWVRRNPDNETVTFETFTRSGCYPVSSSQDRAADQGFSFKDVFVWYNVTLKKILYLHIWGKHHL